MSQNLQGQPRKLEQKIIARVIFYEKYLRLRVADKLGVLGLILEKFLQAIVVNCRVELP